VSVSPQSLRREKFSSVWRKGKGKKGKKPALSAHVSGCTREEKDRKGKTGWPGGTRKLPWKGKDNSSGSLHLVRQPRGKRKGWKTRREQGEKRGVQGKERITRRTSFCAIDQGLRGGLTVTTRGEKGKDRERRGGDGQKLLKELAGAVMLKKRRKKTTSRGREDGEWKADRTKKEGRAIN